MLTTYTDTVAPVAIAPKSLPAPALTHSARIILPTTDNSGSQLLWDWLTRLIAARFGGLTQTFGEGQWVGEGGTLYHDAAIVIDVDYAGNGEGGEYLAGVALAVKEYAAQEAVYLRIDGLTYFI